MKQRNISIFVIYLIGGVCFADMYLYGDKTTGTLWRHIFMSTLCRVDFKNLVTSSPVILPFRYLVCF